MEPNFTAEQQADLRQFGRCLAAIRKQKGWSQEKLALESGLARSYLGGVERGQRNIAVLNILRLARALGCASGELFCGQLAVSTRSGSADVQGEVAVTG